IAVLTLEVADASACQGLERPAKPPPALARVLRDAALLASIARQKHDDAIRFAELVRPQDERVGRIERHRQAAFDCTTIATYPPTAFPSQCPATPVQRRSRP